MDTLIRLANDRAAPAQLSSDALFALGSNPPRRRAEDPRAHTALRDIVRDSTRPEAVRVAALDVCGRDPRPEDVEIFEALIGQTEFPKLQRLAACMGGRPDWLRRLRPALRNALYNYANVEVVYCAVKSLLKGDESDIEFVRAYAEDPAVAKEARQRAGTALYEVEERKRIGALEEQQRQERLKKGQSWEDWWDEQMRQRERNWLEARRQQLYAELKTLDAEEQRLDQQAQQPEQNPKGANSP